MTDPFVSGPIPEPLRLTATEQIVLERLEHEERDAAWPRMGRICRRVIELSRSDDEVDAVLAAHLVRELLFVLPRIAVSVPVERGHLAVGRWRRLSHDGSGYAHWVRGRLAAGAWQLAPDCQRIVPGSRVRRPGC